MSVPGAEQTATPAFRSPPLVEVALAVGFTPVPDFGAVVMARLAELWSDRYPQVQEHQPLPPDPIPGFPETGVGMLVSVGAPQIRLWMLTSTGDRVVQVQRDRMVVNWRSEAAADGMYPRYVDSLRPEFATDFEQLRAFVLRELQADLVATSSAASYVNRYRTDQSGLPSLFRSQVPVEHHLGMPTTTTLSQTWERRPDGVTRSVLSLDAELLGDEAVFTLTGRSSVPSPSGLEEVLSALDTCHVDVVSSFVELTEERRQTEWGRLS